MSAEIWPFMKNIQNFYWSTCTNEYQIGTDISCSLCIHHGEGKIQENQPVLSKRE